MRRNLPTRLDCTGCQAFTTYERKTETVATCLRCKKPHKIPDSLYVVDPERVPYERDESGRLTVVPP